MQPWIGRNEQAHFGGGKEDKSLPILSDNIFCRGVG
jgi:hypothetical protein